MDKFPLNDDTWSLIKWLGGIMAATILTMSRWFFGDIRDQIKDIKENQNLQRDEFLHKFRNQQASLDHIIDEKELMNRVIENQTTILSNITKRLDDVDIRMDRVINRQKRMTA